MTLFVRFVGAVASFLIVLCLLLAALFGFLFGTEGGLSLVRTQTAAAVDRLLGPAYTAVLGEQSFELRPDGLLLIGWSDVSIVPTGRPDLPTGVRRVAVGVRLMPLLAGRLEFDRLQLDGLHLDLMSFAETSGSGRSATSEPPSSGPSEGASESPAAVAFSEVADGFIRMLEQRLNRLRAFQFDTVSVSDIVIESIEGLSSEPVSVRIDDAELTRTDDGVIIIAASLSAGTVSTSLSGSVAFDPEKGVLTSLAIRSGLVPIAAVAPPASVSDEMDERAFGSDADMGMAFSLAREPSSERLVASATILIGPGAIQMGAGRTRIEDAELRLRYREGESRLQLLPSPIRFDGSAFSLEGVVEADGEASGQGANRLRFRIGAPDIRSTAGRGVADEAGEPETASFWTDGIFDPAHEEVRLSSLEVATRDGRLTGSAVHGYGSPGALTSLRLVASSLEAESVKAFWPFSIAYKARQWVLEHVGDEAGIPHAGISLDVRFDRLDEAFRPENELFATELRLDVDVEHADLAMIGDLPRLTELNGHIETEGSRTTVLIQDATVEGEDTLALSSSSVVLTRPPNSLGRELDTTVNLSVAGSIAQLLAVVDREPVGALRTLDFRPEAATGTAQVNATLQLRIADNLPPAEELQDWSIDATLANAALDAPIEGRRLSAVNGRILIVPTSASGELTGAVDDIPAEIRFSLPLGSEPLGPRSLAVDLALTSEKAIDLVPALEGVVDGPIEVKVMQDESGLHADLDLDAATLDLPLVAWQKGKGVEASVRFQIERSEAETLLRDIRVDGDGFSAKGSMVADEGGIRSAEFSGVSLNPGDDIAVSVERAGNGFSISVEGAQLDVRPLLQELKDRLAQPESSVGGGTFDIAASVDRLKGFGSETLNGISLNLASSGGKTIALSLSGSNGGGALTVDLSPRDASQSIRIATEDAGALLDFAGLYRKMEGGAGTLSLLGSAGSGYAGELQLRNFTLVDEPRLSRIVGSSDGGGGSSLSQVVGQDLRTERAVFDQASARLSYRDGGLRVAEGIVRGPVFGSSFEGTLYDSRQRIDISGSFMPAYGINRIFGAIPLVGQILGNGNEGGLIGITYNLAGAFSSPTLTVNPISAIAPGIFRQIFAYE